MGNDREPALSRELGSGGIKYFWWVVDWRCLGAGESGRGSTHPCLQCCEVQVSSEVLSMLLQIFVIANVWDETEGFGTALCSGGVSLQIQTECLWMCNGAVKISLKLGWNLYSEQINRRKMSFLHIVRKITLFLEEVLSNRKVRIIRSSLSGYLILTLVQLFFHCPRMLWIEAILVPPLPFWIVLRNLY